MLYCNREMFFLPYWEHGKNDRRVADPIFNTLRPRQNGRHFADDIFKCIFLNEKFGIWNKISLKFVPKGQINNVPSLVQIMAWRRPGDKPLSEPMVVRSLTHICVTQHQWVKCIFSKEKIFQFKLHWGLFLIHLGREKMAPIFQTTFSNVFPWIKSMNFDWNFTEVCS